MSPVGMAEKSVSLSTIRGGQAEIHQLDSVRAIVSRDYGDGWVVNRSANQYLAGLLIQKRHRKTTRGEYYQREFIDINSAVLQCPMVGQSIQVEQDQIMGIESADGEHMAGELDDLAEKRRQLFGYLTASTEELTGIKDYFAGVADRRHAATNPLKIEAGIRARRMQSLKDKTGRDNPSAILAMSHPLERDLIKHATALNKNQITNAMRSYRLRNWLMTENYMLAHANVYLDILAEDPTADAYYDLLGVAHKIHFRVQPFNQLAFAINTSPNHELDPAAIETTQSGIQFQRLHNYFMQPFRILTAKTFNRALERGPQLMDTVLPATQERLSALETIEIGLPYSQLIGRVLFEGNNVVKNIHRRDTPTAQHAARRVKQLLTYFCLHGERDWAMQEWYSYQL